MRRLTPALAVVALSAGAPADAAAAGEPVAGLSGSQAQIELGLDSGLPVSWTSCTTDCSAPGTLRRLLLDAPGGNRLQWIVPGDAAATAKLNTLGYTASRDGAEFTLTSVAPVGGRQLVHRYRVADGGRRLQVRLDMPDGSALRMLGGAAFVPEPLPGFGAIYTRVRAVVVGRAGQATLDPLAAAGTELPVADWTGLRNRFWSLLFSADAPALVAADEAAPDRPALTLSPARSGPVNFEFYGGPIAWTDLASADPVLDEMLFAALWEWLRLLCFGMLWLLQWLMAFTGNAGWSIVLLSLCVKLLMLPLTRIADRWQDDVNRTASLLKPQLDEIKREFRGEEAHRRTLAVYAEHGVPIMYPLKSLAGFLIQIPVFIAAFDMLGENFALNHAGFLWIDDLAKPDRWLPLPFTLPFFGGYLNLLPFLMAGFTVAASMLQTEASLTPDLMRQQRLRLYLMAGAFFVLFYTFPSGMVLYWTTNNVLHLVKVLLSGRHRMRVT